jgi:hypothetical protein
MVKAATAEIAHYWKDTMSIQHITRAILHQQRKTFQRTSPSAMIQTYAAQPAMQLVGAGRVLRHPQFSNRIERMLQMHMVLCPPSARRVHFRRCAKRKKTWRRKGTPCRKRPLRPA